MKIFCLIFWGIMMAIAPKGFSQIYELSGRVKDVDGNSLSFTSLKIRSDHDTAKVLITQADSVGACFFIICRQANIY
jgi:hypothetical protein